MEDREIIELYFARSERAIRETDEKYGRRVRSLAEGILKNRPDAEECVSDTWLKAWNTIPPTRPGTLGAYLYRIARNLSLDRLRRNKALKRGEGMRVLAELDEVASRVPEDAEGEISAAIQRFLEKQSKENRRMFLLRYWRMDTVAEIAGETGRKEASVRMALSRMRKGLRLELEKEGIWL